jgi:hypothetical protein
VRIRDKSEKPQFCNFTKESFDRDDAGSVVTWSLPPVLAGYDPNIRRPPQQVNLSFIENHIIINEISGFASESFSTECLIHDVGEYAGGICYQLSLLSFN